MYKNLECQLRRCYPIYSHHSCALHVKAPQIQDDSTDCGLFAIATAVNILNELDVNITMFDQAKMRDHLLECFESELITPFPTSDQYQGVSMQEFYPFRRHQNGAENFSVKFKPVGAFTGAKRL